MTDDRRHGAVLYTGGDRLAAGGRNAPHDLFGQRRCRHIDFTYRKPQQLISDGAADDTRFFAVPIEQR